MAKAQSIAHIDHNAGPYEWFSRVIRGRFDEVVSYFPDAIAEDDVEGIHSMRVATRRLRSAISDFELVFDKLDLKRTRKSLSRLADVLGSVRDQDVYIAALAEYRATAPDDIVAAGIDDLLEQHRRLRERSRAKLVNTVTPRSLEGMGIRLTTSVDAQLSEPGLFGPGTVHAAAVEVISARLDDLFRSDVSIYNPSDDRAIHKLRIRAKRLRYSIEQFTQCIGLGIAPFAKEVARLQSALGETHDLGIWIGDLSKRLKKQDSRQSRPGDREATAFLLSEFVFKRAKEYRNAVRIWEQWRACEFPTQVRAAMVQPSSVKADVQ